MMNKRKNRNVDLKNSYALLLQFGLIVTLLVMIGAAKLDIYSEPAIPTMIGDKEDIVIETVIQTKTIKTPPPPPRPPVPIEVPNDQALEVEIINFNTELNLDGHVYMPQSPDPIEDEDIVHLQVERMPELIGGLAGLQKKVKYPEMAARAGIEGRVTIQFVVNKKGEIENPQVIRGIGGGCDEEALKAVMQSKFKPGMQNGRFVRVQYSLPIVFKLQN
ncbi:MAG: energy transducer TonB [Balneolaceae bacterium]